MQIFPGYGFQQSAATPVFLGLLVSWMLTETFGWAFAGIVVPGYLATLLIVEPRSAAIDIGEAVLTYLVARALGEYLSRLGITSRAFGRERFFLVVLVSVLVRVGVEGMLLPAAFSQPSWAYSIGLVVVPLAANACWKTGLARGIVQTGVPMLAVYALLRWVLIPHTSLSLAGFHLLTEDVAASFLGSPKAYFVLLTGALLSSFANVRWGWDFGGILVPALLGLVVIQPTKLLTTGIEAIVLLVVVQTLLTATPIRRWNVEGPRRIVLFASVDYALRFGAAWLLGPRLGATGFLEVTGFGYLLPSLLAVKASQKRDAALVLLPTAILSGAAFVVGTLVGFSFEQLEPQPVIPPVNDSATRDNVAPRNIGTAVRWSAATASKAQRSADDRNAVEPYTLARSMFHMSQTPETPSAPDVFFRDLEDGVCWFGERFTSLDQRRGGPAVFVRCHEPRRPGIVLLLATPRTSTASSTLAGALLAKRSVQAVVVAGNEGPSGAASHGASAAPLLASRLARLGGDQSVVVELVDAEAGSACQAVGIPDSLRADLQAMGARFAEEPNAQGKPLLRVAPDFPLAPPHDAASPREDATFTAAASALDDASPRSGKETPEELLVLRRLVLEPLLDLPTSDAARAQALSAARDLGFRTDAVRRGTARTLVNVLTPTERSPRMAIVVRADGAGSSVVELTHGEQPKLRRFAGALAAALDASALLVTFSGDEERDGGRLMGQARALATWARKENARALVRVEPADAHGPLLGVTLATWAVPSDAPGADEMAQALRRLGLPVSSSDLTPSLLASITRREPTETPTWVVTPAVATLKSFGANLGDSDNLPWPSTPPADQDCGSLAGQLARGELRGDSDPTALGRLAVAAVVEKSVTARRALERARSEGRIGLSLVRADSGVYLAVAGRSPQGPVLGCVSFGGNLAEPRPLVARESTLEACMQRTSQGGFCEVTP